jgi:formiminoglutamase
MDHLHIISRSQLDALISKRPNETKLGERMQTIHPDNWENELKENKARFVLLGIPEDIGVRANYGLGGAHTLWEPALKAIVNTQDTQKLKGEELLLLGAFDFRDMMHRSTKMEVMELRELVAQIDDLVFPVIQKIIAAGKIPIVIGGGHNNAYPLLKGASLAAGGPVNCINLDAHSDYRVQEGRHSGNGFRYAKNKGYMEKYAIIGLHENYNSQNIVEELIDGDDILCSFYEDIFLREGAGFMQYISDALFFTKHRPRGIELDMDCIERTLSSAASPCGISTLQARNYIYACASADNAAYLHITEGAVHLRSGKEDSYPAKLAAYLVTDFIRGCTGN